MEIREIPLHELVLDPTLNLRDRLDQDTVERYADSWNRLPPVTVYEVEGRWLLADGFHRHAAAVYLSKRTIKAEIREGTFTEALDYVAGANLFHGLPLSRSERRRAIEVKLRLHHDWSDRHLADELAVGRELIAKVRRSLTEAGQIPAGATRMGSDGKIYPAAPPREPIERERPGDEPRPILPRGGAATLLPGEREFMDTGEGKPARPRPPWGEDADSLAIAKGPPVPVSTPTIDEMLALMTRQVSDVEQWTHAEGFPEAYQAASGEARGQFQRSVERLSGRVEVLRLA